MSDGTQLGFEALNAALKAAGEETRLRVLALLAEAELTPTSPTSYVSRSRAFRAICAFWPKPG
jgi:DNA-binding transcriptional ArsR family regulator